MCLTLAIGHHLGEESTLVVQNVLSDYTDIDLLIIVTIRLQRDVITRFHEDVYAGVYKTVTTDAKVMSASSSVTYIDQNQPSET